VGFLNSIRAKISPVSPLLLLYHKTVAAAAAFFYGFPANKLRVIAVTGTKGKSTTAHMLASILKTAGYKVGVASTIHFQIGDICRFGSHFTGHVAIATLGSEC